MNVAAILKVKNRSVVTATADQSLLDIAKLLERHGISNIQQRASFHLLRLR